MSLARDLASVQARTGGLTSEVAMPMLNFLTGGGVTYAERYGIPRDDAGSVDRSAAFQNLINNCQGKIVLPPGRIRLTGTTLLAFLRHGLTIEGQGAEHDGTSASEGTNIRIDKAAANFLEVKSCLDFVLRDVKVSCAQVPTSGKAILLSRDAGQGFGTTRAFLERVNFEQVFDAIEVNAASDTNIDRVSIRNIYGSRGLLYTGSSSTLRSDVLNVARLVCDTPAGVTLNYSNRGAWQATTAYSQGDIVTASGFYYICQVSGTSSGSTPTSKGTIGSRDITDGTVTWRYICTTSHAWVAQDNYAYTLNLEHARLITGGYGMRMVDTAASGSSYPTWLRGRDVDCDHCLNSGLNLNRGEEMFFDDLWISSTQIGNGIYAESTFRGGIRIQNSESHFGAQHGMLLENGPVGNQVIHTHFGHNGRSNPNTYNGISLAASATRFSVIGCRLDARPTTNSNDQAYGILVNSGTNDRYQLIGNTGEGNQTALISDTTANATRVVTGNV